MTTKLVSTFLALLVSGIACAQDNFPPLPAEFVRRQEDLRRNQKKLLQIAKDLAGLEVNWRSGVDEDSRVLALLSRTAERAVEDLEYDAIDEKTWWRSGREGDWKTKAKHFMPLIMDLQEVGARIESNPSSSPELPDYMMPLLEGLSRRLRNLTIDPQSNRLHYLPDIPENHHIYEALANWTRAGLIEGRVGRLIRGGRSESNFSIAEMLRQAIRSVDKRLIQPNKEDEGKDFAFIYPHDSQ